MIVRGFGDDVLALLTQVIAWRITRTHTPLQSYLSTALRFGRDDDWKDCDKTPTVISSEAEKYDRTGVWGRSPCRPCVRVRVAENACLHHRGDGGMKAVFGSFLRDSAKRTPSPPRLEGSGEVEYRIRVCNRKPPPWKGGGIKVIGRRAAISSCGGASASRQDRGRGRASGPLAALLPAPHQRERAGRVLEGYSVDLTGSYFR